MPRYGYNPNEWSGKSEYVISLQLEGDVVKDANDETNPALQLLLPIIQQLHDPNPELIIQYEYEGNYEPDTWDCPGGTCHDTWPTGAYLYITQTGLTDLEDQPQTSTDPEYEGLHLQDRYAQPGEPQKIPLDKQTAEALYDAYEKEIYEDEIDSPYESINKIGNTITEDPDIFT